MPTPSSTTNVRSTNQPNNPPWVEIIEQPSSKSTRFRYECEGRFAGSILGKNSTNERKTFPAIKVHNHTGACVVVVSLVTHDDEKPKPHPHTLVGPECRQGVCTKKVKQNLDCIQFPNLGIQCKKKAELKDALTLRQQIRVDPFRTGFEHMEKPQLNNINLMVVKLCFQVFLPDESGKYQRPVPPVCSDPIQDKKSAGELSIHSFLPESCPVGAKEEMILLTGKLPKAEELELRFYEGRNEQPDWEAFANFTQKDIHQSVALTIKIPEYSRHPMPNPPRHKIQVSMELRKKSNPQDRSQSRRFYYLLGDSKNRHRANKREFDGNSYHQGNKKVKHDPGFSMPQCSNSDIGQQPTVLENISMETQSSTASSVYNNGYQIPTPTMYTPQMPQPQQVFQQYGNMQQPQQQPQPHAQHPQQQQQPQQQQRQFTQMENAYQYQPMRVSNGQGQEFIKVRVSDINIYRNDDSGKVFMAPGPTAPNQLAREIELNDDDFAGAELSIDEILKLARENPDSEIHIPSNFSEHFKDLLNPTLSMLEGEVVETSEAVEGQLHTSSLTRELKDMPQTAA